MGKQPGDFSSFVKKGDDRLKVLERADALPDLQSDFASSNVRSLQQRAKELAAAKGTNQMSAAKLNQVLRELERMGRKAGDENMSEEMRQAMQMAEDGNFDEAMESMQDVPPTWACTRRADPLRAPATGTGACRLPRTTSIRRATGTLRSWPIMTATG